MNPRRVHKLMHQRFPQIDSNTGNYGEHHGIWKNIVDRNGSIDTDVLNDYIDRYIGKEFILIEVTRKIGGLIAREDLIEYISLHYGQGTMRITDRDFHGFVVFAASGVIAGWRKSNSAINE